MKHEKWPSSRFANASLLDKRQFSFSQSMTISARFTGGRVGMRAAVCLDCSGSLSIPTALAPPARTPRRSPNTLPLATTKRLASRQILFTSFIVPIFINENWWIKIHQWKLIDQFSLMRIGNFQFSLMRIGTLQFSLMKIGSANFFQFSLMYFGNYFFMSGRFFEFLSDCYFSK